MIEEDLSRIEGALSIRLPDVYRNRVSPFPIPNEEGNLDSQVWGDAGALIALNLRLRVEGEGWPAWLFVIGQSVGDPCGYAIDTRTPDCPVWWLEQMRAGPPSGPTEGPFADWISRWVAETALESPDGRSLLWVLAVWLLLAITAVLMFWAWVA